MFLLTGAIIVTLDSPKADDEFRCKTLTNKSSIRLCLKTVFKRRFVIFGKWLHCVCLLALFASWALLATMFTLPSYAQPKSPLYQPATLVQQAGEQDIPTGFMSDLEYSPPSTELFPDYRNGNQIYKELYVDGLEPVGGVFQPVIDWMDNNLNPFKVMAKNNDRLVAESDNLLDQSLNFVSEGLINMLKLFIYNPNVAVDTPGDQTAFGQAVAGMSFYIRKLAEIVYAIALDLSLLLFILSIWRYWANAAIRGR